ncbi:MAG: hypothetical protein IJ719_06650 [Clostridia bacterium]|nr:hypothetical protein [Clostridia bacterium]
MDAWYAVMSMGFGYLSAAIIFLIVVLTLRKHLRDRQIWRKVNRQKREIVAAGTFTVLSGGNRRLPVGTELTVPYEGTLGSAPGCDIVLPVRKLHMRSAFFWVEGEKLHLVPIQKDAILVDDEPAGPGDEAILLSDAELSVNGLRMRLTIYRQQAGKVGREDPYVTRARRARAHQGRGKGIGSIGPAKEGKKPRKTEKRENTNMAYGG